LCDPALTNSYGKKTDFFSPTPLNARCSESTKFQRQSTASDVVPCLRPPVARIHNPPSPSSFQVDIHKADKYTVCLLPSLSLCLPLPCPRLCQVYRSGPPFEIGVLTVLTSRRLRSSYSKGRVLPRLQLVSTFPSGPPRFFSAQRCAAVCIFPLRNVNQSPPSSPALQLDQFLIPEKRSTTSIWCTFQFYQS